MPIMSSAEEQKKSELKGERIQTLKKFAEDIKASFLVWIKIGSLVSGLLILLYLSTKFILKWDLFYETDLKYSTILFIMFILLLVLVIACWFVAFFLYNTKHKRNTRYN